MDLKFPELVLADMNMTLTGESIKRFKYIQDDEFLSVKKREISVSLCNKETAGFLCNTSWAHSVKQLLIVEAHVYSRLFFNRPKPKQVRGVHFITYSMDFTRIYDLQNIHY